MADATTSASAPHAVSASDAASIKQAVLAAAVAQAIDPEVLARGLIQAFALIDAASSGIPQ